MEPEKVKQSAEALTEAFSDRLDQMDEAEFDLAEVDAYLAALEAADPVSSHQAAAGTARSFQERHPELFEDGERPPLQVVEGKNRRPRGRRIAGRVAALAATIALVGVVAAAAMGFDFKSFFGKWGRGEFWFPGTQETGPVAPTAPPAVTGDFESLLVALEKNGVVTPVAPRWVPDGLKETCTVSREAQHVLYEADYRDEDGHGFTIWLEQRLHSSLLGPTGTHMTEYVIDGRPYMVIDLEDEGYRVFWSRENLMVKLEGEVELDDLLQMLSSITGGAYAAPSPDFQAPGNDLPSMLSVFELPTELAPTWLPQGYEKVEIDGDGGETVTVQAVYHDVEQQRELVYHVEWWGESEPVMPTVLGFEGTPPHVYHHNDVEFVIRDNGDKRIVTWLDGAVTGYLWGDFTADEAMEIIDSFPVWPHERPVPDLDPVIENNLQRGKYDSFPEGLAACGLDAGLAPAIPGGYELVQCESTEFASGNVSVYAAYQRGEDFLSVNVMQYEDEADAQNSATYMKDDNPVVEVVHNGITYYIMSNLDYRTVAWKSGLLEGSIGGPLTLDEAKEIVDSISYAVEAE